MELSKRRECSLAVLILLIVALATRVATFGHPELTVDEAFYFAAGAEMRHGAIPFVDIWDRKPVGHFLLYAAIARVSADPIAYQIAAMLFAFATAMAIFTGTRIAAGKLGAILGGCTYLIAISLFKGHGGQSAVFYNLPVAIAGLLMLNSIREGRAVPDLRVTSMAMFLSGLALTIKTTVVFEVAYFGMVAAVLTILRDGVRGGAMARIAGCALLGVLPTLAITAWYVAYGYGDEFWTAMVTSNLRKAPESAGALHRLGILAMIIGPLVVVAMAAFPRWPKPGRLFLCGWAVAAVVGFLSVPAFYLHYALPLLVPLCVTASGFFGRRLVGPSAFALLAGMAAIAFPFTDFARTTTARLAMDELVSAIRAHGADGPLLVFDGPPLLYTLSDKRFPTPLAFPNHLHQAAERDVSHLSTVGEVRRVLALQPDAVVLRTREVSNLETSSLVAAYIARNCQKVASVALGAEYVGRVEIYGDCRATQMKKPRR